MPATLGELAERFDCELRGDPGLPISCVATLSSASPGAVSFLANPAYRSQLPGTNAGAVILEERFEAECPVAALVSTNPYAVYARVAQFLHPLPTVEPGIDSSASVASDAVVPGTARVCSQAVIGPGACLGEGVFIGEGAVVGANVTVGEGTQLAPRVVLMRGVEIGKRCIFHSGVVVGGDGFGFAREEESWVKVPQLGGVVIGDDVEIGANSTIDRGTVENTVIEDGVKLDNLVQIAHNVRVGAHTVIAALCGISGSTTIGKRCMFGGAVVAVGHLSICDDAVFTFHSTVLQSVTQSGTYSGAFPADEAKRWRRNAARFKRLDVSTRGRHQDDEADTDD